VVAGLGRPRRSGLALVVKRSLAPYGRQHDRRAVFHAENVDAHIDLAHVDETARPQLEFQEALPVSPQRDLVVYA